MKTLYRIVLVAATATCLHGCDNDNNLAPSPPPPPPPPAMASFEVAVENLTNAQPLSPVAVIAHESGYVIFAVGNPATTGLEEMAEGGDNTLLLAEADGDVNVLATMSGGAAIGPAGSETVMFDVLESDVANLEVSVASMLVNTNDGFSAVVAAPAGGLPIGDSWSTTTIAYDAGTEANSEIAADIPGPAGGGEGFNAARNDAADRVAMHSGVVSQDDGLSTSDLTEQHRFDNPVMRVSITRTQ